ncbi:MAG: DUF58 domain-containing protein, partial [Deltaproteobacteria bacterium]|nr:DUF58 domain-containing protein [Deltaproteobacteria bacterium]
MSAPIPQAPDLRIPTLFVDPLARWFLALLLFVSLLFGRPDLSVFCLVLLLLSTGAKLWRRAAAVRVTTQFRAETLRASPGEVLTFAVEAENGSVLPVTVRSRLAGLESLSADGRSGGVRTCRVRGRRRVRLEWAGEAPGRGVYGIGPDVTEAGDPFGLFFRRVSRGKALEIVVYPKRFPVGSSFGEARDLFGCIRAEGLIEDPINLMGTREYQPGRPARAIHWKASVRLNRLQEKVFEPSRRARILLSVDVRGFHEAGDEAAFEETLEAPASIAVRLIHSGVSVGLITNAGMKGDKPPVVPASPAPGQVPSILERMARMTMEPAGDLIGPAGRLLSRTSAVGCLPFPHSPGEAA